LFYSLALSAEQFFCVRACFPKLKKNLIHFIIMFADPDARNKNVRIGIVVVLVCLALPLATMILKAIFVGERAFGPDKVCPARELDPTLDTRRIAALKQACAAHLRSDFKDACGLAAAHFGFNDQYACWRGNDREDYPDIINPLVWPDYNAIAFTAERTIGPHDPLCSRDVVQVLSHLYFDRVVLSSKLGATPKHLRGAEALCVQKLVMLMNMSTASDGPCVLSTAKNWQPLPLESSLIADRER
jgi:hypothetical protein